MDTRIDEFIASQTENRQERLNKIVNYIRTNYPTVNEGVYIAPSTLMPTFDMGSGGVGLGSMKHYISLYLSDKKAVAFMAKLPKINTGKTCVNIRDTIAFPFLEVSQAIDMCFKNKD